MVKELKLEHICSNCKKAFIVDVVDTLVIDNLYCEHCGVINEVNETIFEIDGIFCYKNDTDIMCGVEGENISVIMWSAPQAIKTREELIDYINVYLD